MTATFQPGNESELVPNYAERKNVLLFSFVIALVYGVVVAFGFFQKTDPDRLYSRILDVEQAPSWIVPGAWYLNSLTAFAALFIALLVTGSTLTRAWRVPLRWQCGWRAPVSMTLLITTLITAILLSILAPVLGWFIALERVLYATPFIVAAILIIFGICFGLIDR